MAEEIDTSVLPDLPSRRKKSERRRVMSEEERALKTSPEWKENLAKRGFQKGRAKTGGRKATPKETKEWIAGKSIDVAEFMFNAMNDETQPLKERIKAAQWLGDMSMSKAPSEANMTVNHKHSIADLLTQANQMRLNDKNKTIDITPVIIEPENAAPSLRIRNQRSGDDV